MKNKYEVRGPVTVIFLPLEGGGYAETLIDTEDLGKVKAFKGTYYRFEHQITGNFLTKGTHWESRKVSQSGKATQILLHRIILDNPRDKNVAHIGPNTLDNRKANLIKVKKTKFVQRAIREALAQL